MSYGKYFEEFTVGAVYKHWPGRTITEHDDTWFSLMTMNQHPLHIDAHYAAHTQHGQRLVNGTRKRFGQIDVYINNAGLGYDGPVAEGNLTEWREMIDTNLWGVMIGTREALKIMRRQHRGNRIVLIDLDVGTTLPIGLRVDVFFTGGSTTQNAPREGSN